MQPRSLAKTCVRNAGPNDPYPRSVTHLALDVVCFSFIRGQVITRVLYEILEVTEVTYTLPDGEPGQTWNYHVDQTNISDFRTAIAQDEATAETRLIKPWVLTPNITWSIESSRRVCPVRRIIVGYIEHIAVYDPRQSGETSVSSPPRVLKECDDHISPLLPSKITFAAFPLAILSLQSDGARRSTWLPGRLANIRLGTCRPLRSHSVINITLTHGQFEVRPEMTTVPP